MNFNQQISLSFKNFFSALSFMRKNQLLHLFLIPVIVGIILFVISFIYIFKVKEATVEYFDSGFHKYIPEFLMDVISGFISLIIWLLFFYLFNAINKYIILIVLSPLLAYLSEKTEEIIEGNHFVFSFRRFSKDVFRGVIIAIKNGIKELILIVILFLFSFVPVVGWFLSLVGGSLVTWYYTGFSMMDYYNERKLLTSYQSSKQIYRNKWVAIANGFCFWLLLLVPVAGVVFSPLLSVVSATMSQIKIYEAERIS